MRFLKKIKLLPLLGIAAMALGSLTACGNHEHTYKDEWNHSETLHWHDAACEHEEEVTDLGAHVFDNACDPDCNVCGYTRTPSQHIFLNDCDTTCEVCGHIRVVEPHVYDDVHDATCNECGYVRTVSDHSYDNDCDATCNECGHIRVVGDHVYDNVCDSTCNNCGKTREVGPHTYTNQCDTTCDVCGETREVNSHVYDNDCDCCCNICGESRTTGDHTYTNQCDNTCNECGEERSVPEHVWSNDYKYDEYVGEHWHYCVHCNIKGPREACLFNQEVVDDAYLYQAATTSTNAVYYRSCICGNYEPATDNTFELQKLPCGALAKIYSKTYDGLPLNPEVIKNDPDAPVTITYAKKVGNNALIWTSTAPKDVGLYAVRVVINETETHKGAFIEAEVKIEPIILPVDPNDFDLVVERNSGAGATVLANDVFDTIVEGEEVYLNIMPSDDSVIGEQVLSVTSITTTNTNYQIKIIENTATFVIREAGESYLSVTGFGTSGKYYFIRGNVSGTGFAKGDILKIPNTDITFVFDRMKDGSDNEVSYVGDGDVATLYSAVIIEEMDQAEYEALRASVRQGIILVKDNTKTYTDTYLMRLRMLSESEGGRGTPIYCDGSYVATIELYGNTARKALLIDVYGSSMEGFIVPGEEVSVLVQFINNAEDKTPLKTVILPTLNDVALIENGNTIAEGKISLKQEEIETNYADIAYEGVIGGHSNDTFLFLTEMKYDCSRFIFFPTANDANIGNNQIGYITNKFLVVVTEITDTGYVEHKGSLDSDGQFLLEEGSTALELEEGKKYFIQITLLQDIDAFYLALV